MSESEINKLTKSELIEIIHNLERKVRRLHRLDKKYKSTLQELENSESEFQAIYESANDGIFLIDQDIFIGCNKKALEMFGCTKDDIIGQTPGFFSPSLQPNGESSNELALERIELAYEGKSHFFEWKHTKFDKSEFDAEVSLNRVELSKKFYVLAIVRDISERKKSELLQNAIYDISETTLSAPNLSYLFEKIHEIIGRLIPANNIYIAIYEENIDKFTFPYFVDEEDDPPGPLKLGKTLTEYVYRTGQPLYANPEVMKKLEDDGEIELVGSPSEFWVGVPLKTNNATLGVLAVQSYHKDQILTLKDKDMLVFVSSQIAMAINRVKTENALKASEESYRSFYNDTPVMLQSIDKDGRLISVSNYWLWMMGFTRKEVLGRKFYDFVTEESKRKIISEILPKFLNHGIIKDAHAQIITKNGTILDILFSAISEINSEGDVVRADAVLIDITNKLKTEKALEIEKKYFEELFSTAPEAMVILDLKSNILRINREFTNLFGYDEDEAIGKPVDMLLTNEELRKEANEMTRKVKDGEKVNCETVRIKKDGHPVHVSILGSPIISEREKLAVFGIYRDITVRKEAEEKIQKFNEELSALNKDKDKFFSIVAHDLKSPFTALLGYSEVISQECEDLTKEEIREYSTNLHNVARNIFDLLNNLLDWSRIQTGKLKYEPEDINLLEISQMVSGLFSDYAKKKKVELINDIPDQLIVNGDRNMIYTILRNLTSNALKFTKSGGEIKISAEDMEKHIEVSVEDNGVGMTDKVLEKIFHTDSHHTALGTEKEKGTGLGLRLCKEMVNIHGGDISATSIVNEGSKFTFTIPKV
ncbi:PAS domain S-box protein [Bacteroidota bacterium]